MLLYINKTQRTRTTPLFRYPSPSLQANLALPSQNLHIFFAAPRSSRRCHGNLGPALLQELLDASLRITILPRTGSAHKIPPSARTEKARAVEVDYSSHSSLVDALKTVDVLISTLGFTNLFETQRSLVDACLDAQVSRFIPSEFGNDSANSLVRKLPLFADKIKTQEYLVAKAAQHLGFRYTMCCSNSFLDWQLEVGFMVKLKGHIATLYDGGDARLSATRFPTIGKAVVGVINNLDATKNKHIYFHDVAVTLIQLIHIAEGIDGEEWQAEVIPTSQVEENACELLSSGVPEDAAEASLGFIARACWGEGCGGTFPRRLTMSFSAFHK